MKRSPHLVPLSREHHAALSLARRIQKQAGDAQDLAEPARRLLETKAELLAHFAQEESMFLPRMLEQHPALIQQLIDEHVRLRAYIERIGEGDLCCIHDFASLLIRHVRFEERELFPAFESLFSA